MAESINSNKPLVSTDYRNYSDFSRKAIHIYDEDGNEYESDGWQDRTQDAPEDFGTPLNADNLNAMLDMITYLKNMVGYRSNDNPVSLDINNGNIQIGPKVSDGLGLLTAVEQIIKVLNNLPTSGGSTNNRLTHTYSSLEDAVRDLEFIQNGELVTVVSTLYNNIETDIYIVVEYLPLDADKDDPKVKILVNQGAKYPFVGYKENDPQIDAIIERAVTDLENDTITPMNTTSAVSVSPNFITYTVENKFEVDGSQIPDGAHIISKDDIDQLFIVGPEIALSYDLIDKILRGEAVEDIDSKFDIPDSVVGSILEGNSVDETSTQIDISQSTIDSIIGGTYNE